MGEIKMKKLILTLIIISYGITIISAGQTTLNQDMNLKVGDCWNDKSITNVEGLTLTWKKGCYSQENPYTTAEGVKIEESSKVTPKVILEKDSNLSPDTNFCNLIQGDGDHNIIVYGNNLFSDDYMIDWGNWVYNDIQTRTPYNEFTYSLYFEKNQGDCGFNSYSDVEMGISDLGTYYGLSWFNGISTSKIWFDDSLENKKWDFLLFHELAHVFVQSDHTLDNSILSKDGGDGQYDGQEINTIRRNLQ
jgi:hypothetical protein